VHGEGVCQQPYQPALFQFCNIYSGCYFCFLPNFGRKQYHKSGGLYVIGRRSFADFHRRRDMLQPVQKWNPAGQQDYLYTDGFVLYKFNVVRDIYWRVDQSQQLCSFLYRIPYMRTVSVYQFTQV
jgi:hypothetical protein